MKALVFVLVLANLLFFAFTKGYFGRPENPDAGRVEQQLNPERIRVVGRGEPPNAKDGAKKDETGKQAAPAEKEAPAPAPAPEAIAEKPAASDKPVPAGPEACVAWNDLVAADANKLGTLLEQKFTDFKVERRATPAEGSGWWVFIPPLPSKADADKKAGELKRLGVNDYFIVQEAGPNRFAISLGVFSNESGANEQLSNLKAKGVRSAKMGQRIGKDALHAMEARGPAGRQAALVVAAKTALPEIVSDKCK